MNERFAELPTEQRNPRSEALDSMSTVDMLRVINEADQEVAIAVSKVLPSVAQAVDAVALALAAGGRLRSFGAGTSGRIAVLDASEMHPTFGVPRDMIEGHMAGGKDAFFSPKEGAEDSEEEGAQMVAALAIRSTDVVIGLAASGRTPFVLGVLKEARRRGARTIAITCAVPAPVLDAADIPIGVAVGPEVLTGSTRMKSGTAQKLVLNMITTGAMVRMGFTYGNLMVAVTPTNEKLRARALSIVEQVTGRSNLDSSVLKAANDDVRTACLMVQFGLSRDEARTRLDAAGGSLRRALSV